MRPSRSNQSIPIWLTADQRLTALGKAGAVDQSAKSTLPSQEAAEGDGNNYAAMKHYGGVRSNPTVSVFSLSVERYGRSLRAYQSLTAMFGNVRQYLDTHGAWLAAGKGCVVDRVQRFGRGGNLGEQRCACWQDLVEEKL